MAEGACHVVAFTTQVGLIQALGLMPNFIARRWLGLVAIAALFAFQSIYAVGSCNLGPFTFWRPTAILVLPAVALLAFPRSAGAVTAIAVLLPFVAFSNVIECMPPNGGAPMGYVIAFMFGLPASLLAGLGVGLYAARRRRSEP